MQTLNIGVDVSKAKIDVCIEHTGTKKCLPNRPRELDKWLSSLARPSRIAMEASGQYHEVLAQLAHAKGLEVYVLNPKDVRHYAHALGMRAKTDRVDAQLIARLVAKEHARLHRFSPPSPAQREMMQLVARRGKASAMRNAARASFQGIEALAPQLDGLLACLDALIDAIDARLHSLIGSCPQRNRAAQALRSIPGVGPLVSAALLSSLERMHFASADACVAFHGLDTRVQESGTHRGRRRLSKRGPAEMRRVLYNAAMAAIRSAAWKPVYEHYLRRGWPRTAALMIIARRILRTAWSIHKNNTPFDPARPAKALT